MILENIRRLFQEHGTQINLQEREILFRQGEENQNLYLVTSGILTVYVAEENALPVAVNKIKAGELLGELDAITQKPRSATLIASTPVVLSCLSSPDFQKLLLSNQSLIKTMTPTNCSSLTSAELASIMFYNAYRQIESRLNSLDKENEQLQELLRLREEFEALLVHDLRNPLNTIIVALNLLEGLRKQAENTENIERAFNLARSAIQRMSRMIDTLLDVACMEAGKLILNISEFDLTDLIRDVIETEKTKAPDSVEIIQQAGPGLLIRADSDILRRVLANLLDNALKFAPPHSKITIKSKCLDGQIISIQVIDTGPGVPEEERERIFDKFAQVRHEEQENGRGTGLGLTFCRMAIEAHGGTIRVDDGQSGRGSCFCIEIPRG